MFEAGIEATAWARTSTLRLLYVYVYEWPRRKPDWVAGRRRWVWRYVTSCRVTKRSSNFDMTDKLDIGRYRNRRMKGWPRPAQASWRPVSRKKFLKPAGTQPVVNEWLNRYVKTEQEDRRQPWAPLSALKSQHCLSETCYFCKVFLTSLPWFQHRVRSSLPLFIPNLTSSCPLSRFQNELSSNHI